MCQAGFTVPGAGCPSAPVPAVPEPGRAALTLSYRVYAFDATVRGAFLDARRGFFNNTALCLRVHGREAVPHRLTLAGSWRVPVPSGQSAMRNAQKPRPQSLPVMVPRSAGLAQAQS